MSEFWRGSRLTFGLLYCNMQSSRQLLFLQTAEGPHPTMPILQNPRHEAFAQARAKGARLEDAYEDAGFTAGHGHSSRVSLQPRVAERIAELRALNARVIEANPATTIVALLDLAKVAHGFGDVASVKEARLALLDAARVHNQWEAVREQERKDARPLSFHF